MVKSWDTPSFKGGVQIEKFGLDDFSTHERYRSNEQMFVVW